jgi:phosphate transport system substrate-binding protein
MPSDQTIADGSYPLSRPLFIYVKRASLERPVVQAFVRFYMENAAELVPSTGYHALDAATYQENLTKIQG